MSYCVGSCGTFGQHDDGAITQGIGVSDFWPQFSCEPELLRKIMWNTEVRLQRGITPEAAIAQARLHQNKKCATLPFECKKTWVPEKKKCQVPYCLHVTYYILGAQSCRNSCINLCMWRSLLSSLFLNSNRVSISHSQTGSSPLINPIAHQLTGTCTDLSESVCEFEASV